LAATGLKAAALAQSAEPHLQFKPQVIANASFTSDAKPSPFFPYDRVETTNFNVGIQNQFKFGLMTKFTFGLTDFHYVGISPKYFEARPQMEASLPLMRNAFGRESRLGALAAEKSGLAKSSAHEAACRQILTEAETMYWRLSVAREVEKLAKNSLSRAQALFEWTSRRVRLSLSDKSEGLQATAQLKARQIDLRIAKEDTRSAALAFNAARGKSSDVVEESLPLPSSKLIANWRTPERLKNRPDVDLALAQAETMRATALASAERSRSQLELFGLYALNSPQRKTDTSALSDAWNANRPTSTIGVRLNVPLDRDTIKTVYDAWTAEATEQQSLANRKVFEQERDWSDAIARFGAAQEKLKLLEDLELTQKEKLDYERARQQRGRSTVAQVVLFEAEYDQTAFARVRALAEILNLNAQLKLFSTLASTN
jgi:outer membrane protein TolC